MSNCQHACCEAQLQPSTQPTCKGTDICSVCLSAGVLALPVAEFLAVKHGTSYLGYSQHSSKGAAHPFFASRLHKHEQQPMRTTGADAADAADAEQAASDGAAAAAPAAAAGGAESLARTGSGAAPGSGRKQPPHSPKGKDLGASEDVPLITCSSSATLLEVGAGFEVYRMCLCLYVVWLLLCRALAGLCL